MLIRNYNNVAQPEIDPLEGQISAASNDLERLKSDLIHIKDRLNHDFGPEDVFLSLHDRCFELRHDK